MFHWPGNISAVPGSTDNITYLGDEISARKKPSAESTKDLRVQPELQIFPSIASFGLVSTTKHFVYNSGMVNLEWLWVLFLRGGPCHG